MQNSYVLDRRFKEKYMAEAVIVESTRSAIGKCHGALSGVRPADLWAQVLNAGCR